MKAGAGPRQKTSSKGGDIGRGLLQEIINDTKLTKEEFLGYLD